MNKAKLMEYLQDGGSVVYNRLSDRSPKVFDKAGNFVGSVHYATFDRLKSSGILEFAYKLTHFSSSYILKAGEK